MTPKGAAWEQAARWWRTLPSDEGAVYDTEIHLDTATIEPQVTWGTSPQDVVPISGAVPDPKAAPSEDRRRAMERSLEYMGLRPGTPMEEVKVDTVFIGSCTNGRIEDLRVVAGLVQGKRVSPTVRAMIVPGSGLVKHQAEAEGLDAIFTAAGFEWREAGCSMCLGMNPDQLKPGERCAQHQQPQLRGPAGQGGADASGEPRDGGSGGADGASGGRSQAGLRIGLGGTIRGFRRLL